MNPLRLASGALAALWMATIYYLSSHPMPQIDLDFQPNDKLAHLLAYGMLGALLLGAMRWREGYTLRQALLAALLATLYGLTDEWHQAFTPGRHSDGLDIVADALGALLGSLALRWALRRSTLAQTS